MRRFLSSRECSCSPSSMVHCAPLYPTLPTCKPPGTMRRPRYPLVTVCYEVGSTGSPTRTCPASATAAWTPNGSGSVVSAATAVAGEGLQRVEVGAARLRILRRDRAAADVPLRDHDGLADPHAAAVPTVLSVRFEPLDAEVHRGTGGRRRLDAKLAASARERRRPSTSPRRSTAVAARQLGSTR